MIMPGRLIMLCLLARHLAPKLARDSHYSSQAIKQEGQAHPPRFLAVFVDDGCIWFYVFCCVWYNFLHKFDNWQLTADQSAFECQYDMSTSFAYIHKMTWVTCTLGCFSKDTLKENKKPNPVRNWGGPRENISRRRG